MVHDAGRPAVWSQEQLRVLLVAGESMGWPARAAAGGPLPRIVYITVLNR
jgi:hypothetical protein